MNCQKAAYKFINGYQNQFNILITSQNEVTEVDTTIKPLHNPNSNTIMWDKAMTEHHANYRDTLDQYLLSYRMPNDAMLCRDVKCTDLSHISAINELSAHIVNCCIIASEITLPSKTDGNKGNKTIPG